MSDLNKAIVEAIEKLNRTDGEGIQIANELIRTAESERLIKDCYWCGDTMTGWDHCCSVACSEAYNK